ncbi:MAG: CapA family protein [Deltaproteobacteria bacterium]|nr:CapA family protein [Deltaproteobacteria bacterium]
MLVVGAAWLALPLWLRSTRGTAWRDLITILVAVWFTEVAAVRVAGLYAYGAHVVLAPLGVCLPVTLVRAALLRSALSLTAGHPGGRRALAAAALALVDAALLEVLGVSLGLWRWSATGALSPIVPVLWAGCALGLALVPARARAWAPGAALLAAAALVTTCWFALARWLPPVAQGAALAPVVALAALDLWLVAALATRARAAPVTIDPVTPSAPRDARRAHACTGLLLLALVVVPPPTPRELSPDEPLGADERSLVLVGDVMLGRNVARGLREGDSFDRFFAATKPYLEGADLAFGNLESVVAARGTKKQRGIALRAPPTAAPALARAGFDVLSVANNHVADYGADAIAEELELFAAVGVVPVGVGAREAPQQAVIVERAGHTVGFLAYCDPRAPKACSSFDRKLPQGAYRATEAALARDVPALRRRVDTVVVSLHWGTESRPEPASEQVALGRRIIDLGADVVAGHHPHVPQRAERYRGGVILYSMGNFVFDQHWTPAHMSSGLYRVIVGKEGVRRVAVLPVRYQRRAWVPTPERSTFLEVGSVSRLR